MKPEHQTLIAGAVILLLIIGLTVIFSFASSHDQGVSENSTNISSGSAKTVTAAANVTAKPTAKATKATAAPKPGDSSAAVPAKAQNATVKLPVNASTAGYLRYVNDTYLFSIDYPADWTVAEMNKTLLKTVNQSRIAREPGITVVEFYSPGIVRCDPLNQDDCVLVRSEVRVDVDMYRNTSRSFEEYYINDTVRLIEDYPIQIHRKDPQILINGRKAFSLDYHTGESSTSNGINVRRVYTVMGDRVFIITCHSHDPKDDEEDQYIKYSGVFDHMIRSFDYAGILRVL